MYNPKVAHAHLPNSIVQMRSGEAQAPFIAGGNQTAYYLGLKGNNITSPECCFPKEGYSTFEKIIKIHSKK